MKNVVELGEADVRSPSPDYSGRAVEELLNELGIPHEVHTVFPLGASSLVADFVLPEQSLIVGCWMSESRRGIALTWVERNAAYIDLKFKRLKECYVKLSCLGLVEVPWVDSQASKDVVGPIMLHANLTAYSINEFETKIKESVISPRRSWMERLYDCER